MARGGYSRKRHSNSFRRSGPKRAPYPRVLIVCEGSKTEPTYLRDLANDVGLNPANVVIDGSGGSAPESVVQRAINCFSEDSDFDAVYCVIDRDEHSGYQGAVDRIRSKKLRRKSRHDASFYAITSVPCFEYWLILHFQYSDAPIERAGATSCGDMAVRELRKHMPSYSKSSKDIYQVTVENLDTAINNAIRALDESELRGNENPCTRIHELVDALRSLDRPG